MRAVALLSLLAAGFLSIASPARADTLLGLVAMNELIGVNLEYAGNFGSVYGVVGTYQARTGYEFTNMTGYLGFRRYVESYAEDTFFGGVVAGDMAGGVQYQRYGGGGEFGYQWVNDNLRVSLQAGLVIVGEAKGIGIPSVNEVKPQGIFGAGVSIRFH